MWDGRKVKLESRSAAREFEQVTWLCRLHWKYHSTNLKTVTSHSPTQVTKFRVRHWKPVNRIPIIGTVLLIRTISICFLKIVSRVRFAVNMSHYWNIISECFKPFSRYRPLIHFVFCVIQALNLFSKLLRCEIWLQAVTRTIYLHPVAKGGFGFAESVVLHIKWPSGLLSM